MSGNIKILAIDDIAENLVLLKTLLAGTGYELCVAKTVRGGFEVLNNTKIDLILLDIEMPEENGFDFIKRLKSGTGDYKNIPVIFVTGTASKEVITKAAAAGARAYVLKPVKKEILIEKIKECLAPHQDILNKIAAFKNACSIGNIKGAEETLNELKQDFALMQKSTNVSVTFESIISLIALMEYGAAAEKATVLENFLRQS